MDFSIVGIWWWYVFKFAFGEVTDLFFPSWECLQINNMKVNLLYSTHLALCIPLFLGKGTNNRDKGLPWVCDISNLLKAQNQTCHLRFHSQITLDLRPKSMTYESRWWTTAWAPGPGPCEPIRSVPSMSGRRQRVRVPANQSETFPLCQAGDSVFLTGTCTWEPSAWGDSATPCSEGTRVLH